MPQLWQQIITGQAKNIILLAGALVLFFYFLPTVIAFTRGHRRFWPILICNVLLTLVQSPIFHVLFPGFFVSTTNDLAHQILVVLIAFYGPGWLVLMAGAAREGRAASGLALRGPGRRWPRLTGVSSPPRRPSTRGRLG